MAINQPLPDGFPPRTTIGVTPLGHGVSLEWLHNGYITLYTLDNTRREAVDVYINTCLITLQQLEPNQIGYSIIDLSHPDVSLITPYFRQRLPEVVSAIDKLGLTVFSGVVLDKGLFQTLMVLFGEAFTRKASHIKQRYFTDRNKAIAWVISECKPYE